MSISQKIADEILAKCHRRCCVCHRFCGVKMELHHIEQQASGGTDVADNLIPLCFECHAEVALYNNNHPRGRKYHPGELRKHRDQWFESSSKPGGDTHTSFAYSVGPFQALLEEIAFNDFVLQIPGGQSLVKCPLETRRFDMAMDSGSISLLKKELRDELYDVYRDIKEINRHFVQGELRGEPHNKISGLLGRLRSSNKLTILHGAFMKFLNPQQDS